MVEESKLLMIRRSKKMTGLHPCESSEFFPSPGKGKKTCFLEQKAFEGFSLA